MASRNRTKAEEAIAKIKQGLKQEQKKKTWSTEGEDKEPFIEFLQFDLALISSGKTAAEEFLSKEERLDMLINNAGIVSGTPHFSIKS